MTRLQFGLNQKIEFIHEEGELGTSLVQDFGEGFFLVTIPLKGHQKRLLQVGKCVTGIYYDENDKLYLFKSKVLERIVENIPLYKLSMPDKLSKVQRRNYVRISITMPIKFAYIRSKAAALYPADRILEKNHLHLSPWKMGTTLDLSGGGMKLRTAEPLGADQLILIQLDIEGLRYHIKGKAMRSSAKILSGQVIYDVGIKFVDLSESERDKIIGFIFSKFRDKKQKGIRP